MRHIHISIILHWYSCSFVYSVSCSVILLSGCDEVSIPLTRGGRPRLLSVPNGRSGSVVDLLLGWAWHPAGSSRGETKDCTAPWIVIDPTPTPLKWSPSPFFLSSFRGSTCCITLLPAVITLNTSSQKALLCQFDCDHMHNRSVACNGSWFCTHSCNALSECIFPLSTAFLSTFLCCSLLIFADAVELVCFPSLLPPGVH